MVEKGSGARIPSRLCADGSSRFGGAGTAKDHWRATVYTATQKGRHGEITPEAGWHRDLGASWSGSGIGSIRPMKLRTKLAAAALLASCITTAHVVSDVAERHYEKNRMSTERLLELVNKIHEPATGVSKPLKRPCIPHYVGTRMNDAETGHPRLEVVFEYCGHKPVQRLDQPR